MNNRIVFLAQLRALPGKGPELKQCIQNMVEACRQHPGLQIYWAHENLEDEHDFLYYEHYADKQAFDFHMSSPEMQAYRQVSGPLLAERKTSTWHMLAHHEGQ